MPTNKDNTVLVPLTCAHCLCALPTNGFIRYARFGDEYVCLSCASKIEKEWLRTHDKCMLYYDDSKNIISDFTGLFIIKPRYHTQTRYYHIVWFVDPYGNKWVGRNRNNGYNQTLHCKRVAHF